MNQTAAIYARVSSDRQKEQDTIASQTAALQEYALAHQYTIPPEWVFEDEGFSGSVLVRPGLERLRDLIAEGAIATVLVYGPDRLSRNYAYQVLLLEEFARQGTQVVFLKTPASDTPEQRLLLQFQGMIAEYERAQIAERCRRGKRHRARAGVINVLSTAPYGYRYVKKTEAAQAYYQVVESEAEVVRKVFAQFTTDGLSIRTIAQQLNAQQIPTRTRKAPWTHSTVWGMLRNSAYQGKACFGKTEPAPPQRLTRISRQKGPYAKRSPVKRKRPPEDWIEIAVPALVGTDTFAMAQERLALNKKLSARHTKEPSLLQSILVCAQCGYGLYRMGVPAPRGRRLCYYRCGGRDRKGPHRVGVDLRHGQREDVEHHRHMAGNEVLHCRRGSAVGNVNDVEPADLFELLGDDVAGASVPLRGVGQFARIGLRMRDQLLQRTGGDGGIDHQNVG